jgi:predicted TIM-barrel fold metal-dependent hydrolase
MPAALLGNSTDRKELWTGAVIDCDVHAHVPSLDVLFPHMEPQWVEFCKERSMATPQGLANVYPPGAPTSARPEWRQADGSPAGTSVDQLQQHLLDPWDVEHAIVNCYYAVDWVRHPDFGPAFARAVNNWLIAEWLDKDPRLRASMVVTAHDPREMIKEIERVGGHPGFVQVFMPVRTERLYGHRTFHPVWHAMADRGLVFGLHWGGVSEFTVPSPTGWASWFVEEYAQEQQLYQAQLMSMVAEGVFSAVPDLRVAVLEVGFTWLPPLWWRMETKRKGLRRDIPWVNEPIWELFRRQVRFSVAPFDAGPPEQLAKTVEWLGSDDMLMFATDYPHAHNDELATLLGVLSEDAQTKLMAENARAFYRL